MLTDDFGNDAMSSEKSSEGGEGSLLASLKHTIKLSNVSSERKVVTYENFLSSGLPLEVFQQKKFPS